MLWSGALQGAKKELVKFATSKANRRRTGKNPRLVRPTCMCSTEYRCLHKKRPHYNIAIYSDMRYDLQKTSRNAYRCISSYYNVGVFYADTGTVVGRYRTLYGRALTRTSYLIIYHHT